MQKGKAKISFFGASQEVTGSNYMVENGGRRILVDCGFFQGARVSEERNSEKFLYDPAGIDAIIITHAHLDHIGRLPKLVRERFTGKIYSTPPTKDLSNLMLVDSLGVLRKENKNHEALYDEEDVEKTMRQWEAVDYHEEFSLGDCKINFKDAGHILGSAMAEININGAKIVFTGDLGNSPEPLLRDTEKIDDADFLVIDGTYGNKTHEDKKESQLRLERIIEDTIKRGGVLMIPAFSLERTQRILFQVNDLVEHARIPPVPIFLDSPLSIKATAIYKKYSRYYNENAKEILYSGDDIFNFPGLQQTLATEESIKINDVPNPKIIIAGSGMCNGGRIIRHLVRYLPDSRNTLLLVSFQAAGSLGRMLEEGNKKVSIMGENIFVEARVEKIEGYSSHLDMEGLYNFIKNTADNLKEIFVVHGEAKSDLFFVQRIRDQLGLKAVAPKFGETFQIDI